MWLLQQEHLVAATLQRHEVRFEQVEHAAAIQAAGADALRELHLHEEVAVEARLRNREPDLVVLLIRVDETGAMRCVLRDFRERTHAWARRASRRRAGSASSGSAGGRSAGGWLRDKRSGCCGEQQGECESMSNHDGTFTGGVAFAGVGRDTATPCAESAAIGNEKELSALHLVGRRVV
jgi:hypothetical protein